tara:strand:- start:479 stop:2059 length:1581 start_codon:yes stop_codon:yes gene_type:complete
MAQTIYIKNSAVTGVEPTSLGKGEIALNISDGNLFYGDAGGNVSQNFSFIHSGATSIGALTATSGTFRSNVNISGTTHIIGVTTLASSVLTTTDINGGTIDGCNITIGEGKTLDVQEGIIDLRSATQLKTTAAQNLAILQGAGTNVDIGAHIMRASTFYSDASTGTAPLTILSTTVVPNLHATSATSVMTNANLTGDITSVGNATSIASDVIINADVKSDAAIAYSKLAALSDGNILVGNGSNVATSVNPSGDIDVTNAGVFSITSDVIINADVKSDAAIVQSKLNTNVDLGGSITFGNQADDVVTFTGPISTAGLTSSGVVDITNTTDASDATGDTGALRTEGGASIAKKLYVGSTIVSDNEQYFSTTGRLVTANNTSNYFGPNSQGVNYYYWNRDLGTSSTVITNKTQNLNSGFKLPYKAVLTGYHLNIQGRSTNDDISFTLVYCDGMFDGNVTSTSQTLVEAEGAQTITITTSNNFYVLDRRDQFTISVGAMTMLYPRFKKTSTAAGTTNYDFQLAIQYRIVN